MKNTTHTVYIDMDGVLCNYVKGVCKVFGFDYDDFIEEMKPGEYDLSKHPAFIDMKFENDMIDIAIQDDILFWSELEPYPEAKELVDFIDDNFEKWRICTTPKNYPECYAGKVQWLHDQFTIDFDQIIMIQDKSQLAGKNRILIDDCDKNTNQFFIKGGDIYSWGRKWNNFDSKYNTVYYLYTWLKEECKILNINLPVEKKGDDNSDPPISVVMKRMDFIAKQINELMEQVKQLKGGE